MSEAGLSRCRRSLPGRPAPRKSGLSGLLAEGMFRRRGCSAGQTLIGVHPGLQAHRIGSANLPAAIGVSRKSRLGCRLEGGRVASLPGDQSSSRRRERHLSLDAELGRFQEASGASPHQGGQRVSQDPSPDASFFCLKTNRLRRAPSRPARALSGWLDGSALISRRPSRWLAPWPPGGGRLPRGGSRSACRRRRPRPCPPCPPRRGPR